MPDVVWTCVLINVLVGGNNLTAITSLMWSSETVWSPGYQANRVGSALTLLLLTGRAREVSVESDHDFVFGVQCCFWVSGARLTATFRHIRVRSGYAEQIGFTLISYLLQPSGCRYAWFVSLLVAGAPCSNSATFNWRADRKSRIETATPVLTPAHKSQKQRQIKAFLLILRLGTLCVLCL